MTASTDWFGFEMRSLEREVELVGDWSSERWTSDTVNHFKRLYGELVCARQGKTTRHRMEVPLDRPLRTTPSRAYEPGGKARQVYGEVAFCYEFELVRTKKDVTAHICGKATSLLSVRDAETESLCARWHLDVQAPDGPGTVFHVQLLPLDDAEALPVPRLPSVSVLPTDAVDLLLVELFREVWVPVEGLGPYREYAKVQRARTQRLLGWQMDKLKGSATSSWRTLHTARPKASDRLFL